jgi:hypothetical protein
MPAELSDLVMQLLHKDRDRRPASAALVAEVLQGLETKVRRAQEKAAEKTVAVPSAAPAKASPARHRLPLLVGSLLLAGLVGLGLWAAGLFRYQTEQGDLVLQTDDDDFAFVPVKGGGLTLEDHKSKKSYHVKVVPLGKDDFELEVTDAGAEAELNFKTKSFAVKRGGKVLLKAWFERKDTAPTPAQAARIREAARWALAQGCFVTIRKDGQEQRVQKSGHGRVRKDFPPGAFRGRWPLRQPHQ